ncbi:patched domain-containing protein 3-like [Dendronephthya gigantea]|uniref:patched domain-containing protein 3-like n=1 Tax=Dendronephthya gigantea TaxID=151771 RepID=UPI00106A4EFA|nr:patched domain-containing protein 3-like [Dendronephthya gigantea]
MPRKPSLTFRGEPYNPYEVWLYFCSYYLKVISAKFRVLGEFICRRTWTTFIALHVLLAVLACGFTQFKFANRWEELYVPEGCRAISDLKVADKYFNLDYREEIVILTPKYPDISNRSSGVLTKECFQEALEIHKAITRQKDFIKYCTTLSKETAESISDCVMVNPLDIVTWYGNGSLNNVPAHLSLAYYNVDRLASNGRAFYLNLPAIFGKTLQPELKYSGSLMMRYFLRNPQDETTLDKVLTLEKRILDELAGLKNKMKHVDMSYASTRSVDDAIGESTGSDIRLVSVTFILMISFACIVSGNIRESARSHSLLSLFGVLAVVYGIAAGLGFGMWLQLPFISMVGVLPFLVLGIGLDNMFLIIHELDRVPLDWPVTQRIAHALSQTGPTVTMTSVTNVVAFAVSTLTSFPAIRIFCIYASLCIAFAYLFIITFFVAASKFDADRIKAGKIDVLLCQYSGSLSKASEYLKFHRLPHFSSTNIMKRWASFIVKTPIKQIVIMMALTLFALGMYGTFHIDQRFDQHVVAKEGSYFKNFIRTTEKYYDQSVQVNLVVIGEHVEYSDSKTQQKLMNLEKIAFSNDFYLVNASIFWLPVFKRWATGNQRNLTGPDFYNSVKMFVNSKAGQMYKQDIVFNEKNTKIIASRMIVYTISTTDSLKLRDAMLTLREDIDEKSPLPSFPIAKQFISYEQYALTAKETVRNLLIAAIAILGVSSVYLVHPIVILFVFLSFASLVIELFGLMYIWDVSLNGISMIGLVMAIGYSVDYSAHVAHAFVVSDVPGNDQRIVRSLSTVGISVLMGGVSTFLGIVVIAFSESELFHIFFRILFGIVVLGLLHGLLFLPVLLATFCPSFMRVAHQKEEVMLPNDPIESPTEIRAIEICEKETTV